LFSTNALCDFENVERDTVRDARRDATQLYPAVLCDATKRDATKRDATKRDATKRESTENGARLPWRV
jgi:hypothetical protein